MAHEAKVGILPFRMGLRTLITESVIATEQVWVSKATLIHQSARLIYNLQDPGFFIENACFAFGRPSPTYEAISAPGVATSLIEQGVILRPATEDMHRAHILVHLNEPLVVGRGAEAQAYTIVSTKGSGETAEDVFRRAQVFANALGESVEHDLQTRREYLSQRSPDPEGYYGRESRMEEMFLEAVLHMTGVRVSHVQAVVPMRKEPFRQWVEETAALHPNSPYDAVLMLGRVRQDGVFGPELITRFGTTRYQAMGAAEKRGHRFALVETMQMNAKAFLAEISAKGEQTFRTEYNFVEPNLVQALEAIVAGSAKINDYMCYLGLEIQLAAYNFGRSLWTSMALFDSRLLVDDPANIQNYGFVATMHDFEEKLKEKPEVVIRSEYGPIYMNHFRKCFMEGPAIFILRNMLGAALPDAYLDSQSLHRFIDRGFQLGFYPPWSKTVVNAMRFDVERLHTQYMTA